MDPDLLAVRMAYKDLVHQEQVFGYRPGGMPTTAKSRLLKFHSFKPFPCQKINRPNFAFGLTNTSESYVDGSEGKPHIIPKLKTVPVNSSPGKTIAEFLKSKPDIDEVTPEIGTIKKVLQPS